MLITFRPAGQFCFAIRAEQQACKDAFVSRFREPAAIGTQLLCDLSREVKQQQYPSKILLPYLFSSAGNYDIEFRTL